MKTGRVLLFTGWGGRGRAGRGSILWFFNFFEDYDYCSLAYFGDAGLSKHV